MDEAGCRGGVRDSLEGEEQQFQDDKLTLVVESSLSRSIQYALQIPDSPQVPLHTDDTHCSQARPTSALREAQRESETGSWS